MKHKQYLSYKDSGIEHIGPVPTHWNIIPLKRAFKIVGGSTPKSDQESYWDGEIVWVTPADLSKVSSMLIRDSQRKITLKGLSSCGTTLVPPGSLVLSTRAPIGSLAIAGISLCTNQGCKSLMPFQNFHSRFFGYLLSVSSEVLNVRGKGTTFLELSGDELGIFEMPIPPTAEQLAITAFLDRETAKIDTLIAKQECLIDLLTERIDSLVMSSITSSTTKELRLEHTATSIARPVTQKEGEIYTPIGLFNRGRGLFHKEAREMADMGDSDFFWIEAGDLILSGQFAWEGAVALAGKDENGCVVSHRYPVLRGKKGIALTEYLYALLTTKFGDFLLNENSRGAAGRNRPLNINSLLKEKIPVVDMRTQEKVAQAIHARTRLLSKISKQINLLKERRSALISAAVTGKIDVRDEAIREAA